MNCLQEFAIQCPYCGESITLIADTSDADQSYIEDCEVCCRPISVNLTISTAGVLSIEARDENDV